MLATGWEIFLYVLFILAAITFIVLAWVIWRPVKTTNQVTENHLQSNYDVGNGQIVMNRDVVPFQIFTGEHNRNVQNAATFSDTIIGSALVTGSDKVVGNSFQIFNETTIVISLQIIADFVGLDEKDSTARTVAIYNLDTRQLLVSAQVSASDPLESGFYTFRLDPKDYVSLTNFVNYAIVSTVSSFSDSTFVAANTVQVSQSIRLLGRAEIAGTSLVLPPTDSFVPLVNNLAFGGFQIQGFNKRQVVFSVDAVNGYATVPPNYVYNLNVSTTSRTTVQIDPGLCIDFMNYFNMVNPTALTLSTAVSGVPNALDEGSVAPNQWYAIFLMFSTSQSLPVAGLISKNRQQPVTTPIGYNTFRRVGWARTDEFGVLLGTTQSGNGARRNTVYNRAGEIAVVQIFTPAQIIANDVFPVPLDLVSPLGTSAVLRVRYSNGNVKPGGGGMEFDLNFRLIGSLEVFATVRLLNTTVPGGNVAADAIVTIAVPPIPLPHAIEMTISSSDIPVENVDVTIIVQSFFDDL